MTTLGADYSTSRPSLAAMKTAGVRFVCRYIGSQIRGTGRSTKWLSPSEAQGLHAAGLDVVVVFETSARRADGGRTAGLADAHTAVAELAYCGLPSGQPVYFAVDWDAEVGPLITAYFKAIAEVLGVKRVGAYGGYRVIKALFDKGLITYAWQTYAWSAGQWDPRRHIEQYANDQLVGDAAVDYDRALKADFGQWPAKPLPAPTPKPFPGRNLRYIRGEPLMHGSDVRWVQHRLNARGAHLTVDGEYGPHTRDAVEVFQKTHHLAEDGVVGRHTWAALAA